MPFRLTDRIFLYSSRVFFEELSPKFQVESLKNLMDMLYIIYEIVACKFEILSENYLKLYDEIVEKEITIAKISSKDFILVIGGGSLPATPILIAKKTKAKVISIDKDPLAIKNASKYIETHEIDVGLELKHADGKGFPVKNFDVIFVLYGIKKNSKILEYLSENIKNNTLVIFRTTSDSFNQIEKSKMYLSTLFEVKEQIESKRFGKTNSFLLTKKILN